LSPSSIPVTLTSFTGGGGRHYAFRHPDGSIKNRTNIRPGIDFRGDGGYIIAPPSLHMSGTPYRWNNVATKVADLPARLIDVVNNRPTNSRIRIEDYVHEGNRNNYLTCAGGKARHEDMKEKDLHMYQKEESLIKCKPPLSEAEVSASINQEKSIFSLHGKRLLCTAIFPATLGYCYSPWPIT
jgi:putative DNA primase/helicase